MASSLESLLKIKDPVKQEQQFSGHNQKTDVDAFKHYLAALHGIVGGRASEIALNYSADDILKGEEFIAALPLEKAKEGADRIEASVAAVELRKQLGWDADRIFDRPRNKYFIASSMEHLQEIVVQVRKHPLKNKSVSAAVGDILDIAKHMLEAYGVRKESLSPDDFGMLGKDGPVVLAVYDRNEPMRRIMSALRKAQETIYSWNFPEGFDDWRAALVYTKNKTHRGTHASSGGYVQAGLTSEAAVRQVNPRALCEVFHTFGVDEAARYIAGDVSRFVKLIHYAKEKGVKQYFSVAGKDWVAFEWLMQVESKPSLPALKYAAEHFSPGTVQETVERARKIDSPDERLFYLKSASVDEFGLIKAAYEERKREWTEKTGMPDVFDPGAFRLLEHYAGDWRFLGQVLRRNGYISEDDLERVRLVESKMTFEEYAALPTIYAPAKKEESKEEKPAKKKSRRRQSMMETTDYSKIFQLKDVATFVSLGYSLGEVTELFSHDSRVRYIVEHIGEKISVPAAVTLVEMGCWHEDARPYLSVVGEGKFPYELVPVFKTHEMDARSLSGFLAVNGVHAYADKGSPIGFNTLRFIADYRIFVNKDQKKKKGEKE